MVKNAKLKGWIAEHGYSQRSFAEAIGMPYSTFISKMSGLRDWTMSEVNAILKYTDCRFEELF